MALNPADHQLFEQVRGAPGPLQRRAMAKAITLLESTRADHRARADEAKRQRNHRHVGIATGHHCAVDEGPQAKTKQRAGRPRLHRGGVLQGWGELL